MSSSAGSRPPAPDPGRPASRRRPRAWLRAAGRTPVWLRWTAVLVLVPSVVAGVLWTLDRTSGSSSAGRDDAAGSGAATGTVVSLTFDNGRSSQYRYARPLLREHGLHATFYVSPDRISGPPCCMSWQEVQQLYREGDEIGGSSADGANLTTPSSPDPAQDYAAKKEQVCGARDRLAGLGLDPRSFAYPAGKQTYEFPTAHSSLTDLVAACGYSSGRVIGGLSPKGGRFNAVPPADPYTVRTPESPAPFPITLEELQRTVTTGAGAGHWIPLVFDDVCHQEDPSYASCMAGVRPVDDVVLAAFLRWLRDAGAADGAPAGTTVRTVREVMGAPPQPPLPLPSTTVSLTFDYAYVTQVLAGDLLRAHRMHGTFFINTGPIDGDNPFDGSSPEHLTWAQIVRLHLEGNEIGGLTDNHVDLTDPGIPESVKRDEVCGNRTRLWQMGLDPQSFAYPYGRVDQAAEQLVRSCGYLSARATQSASPDQEAIPETVPPVDPFATRALGTPASPWTLADLQGAVVRTTDSGGGWVQLVFHRVCRSSDPGYRDCMAGGTGVDEGTLAAFLDWLEHGAPPGTRVRTVGQVIANAP